MSQAQKWVRKRDDEILNFRNKWLFGIDAGGCRQTMAVLLHMHSGFPAKVVEQKFVTSLNDIMRISCAIEGGKYKRGNTTRLEEFGCCYYCHLGVSAQVLGSLLSHRPSTLAVSVPLE